MMISLPSLRKRHEDATTCAARLSNKATQVNTTANQAKRSAQKILMLRVCPSAVHVKAVIC